MARTCSRRSPARWPRVRHWRQERKEWKERKEPSDDHQYLRGTDPRFIRVLSTRRCDDGGYALVLPRAPGSARAVLRVGHLRCRWLDARAHPWPRDADSAADAAHR